jgi:hypothetical protein
VPSLKRIGFTAVLFELSKGSVLVMAYYGARNGRGEVEREADLIEQLEAIRGAIQRARSETEGRLLEVILYTDFNRHNVL